MAELFKCQEKGCNFVTNCYDCYEIHMIEGGDKPYLMHRTWASRDLFKIYIHDPKCNFNVSRSCEEKICLS